MFIEGYFSQLKTARKAVEELKAAGIPQASVDMNDHYIRHLNLETNLPGTVNTPSLTGLVLESGGYAVDPGKAPLAAASPMVSGFGNFEEVADVNCKVKVQVTEKDQKRVQEIIQKHGGELESPNTKIPERLENLDIPGNLLPDGR